MVRRAPATRRSPKTAGLPPVSSRRPPSPRARRTSASHSPVARTDSRSWLTERRRRKSARPSATARRREARRVSKAGMSSMPRKISRSAVVEQDRDHEGDGAPRGEQEEQDGQAGVAEDAERRV